MSVQTPEHSSILRCWIVERVIGSIRRECLDHVIVLHEHHLRRLLIECFHYYHNWRTHRALAMDCPRPRLVQRPELGLVREVPEVGGLHQSMESVGEHYMERTTEKIPYQ
jgi:hypothetical protein